MLFNFELERLLRLDDYSQLEQWMTNKSSKVTNRDIVLLSAIWCYDQENIRNQINQWLTFNGFNKLNLRDELDCFFIYVYKAFQQTEKKGFDEYLILYQKLKGEYDTYIESKTQANDFFEIQTFGDLYKKLRVNSMESASGTMLTRTIKPEEKKVEELLESGLTLAEFLDRIRQDENIKSYRNRATLSLQRMFYYMLKSAVDNLYNHNLPKGYEEQFIAARNYALTKKDRDFNRYIEKNRLFLSDVKTTNNAKNLKTWLLNNGNSTEKDCLEWLQDKEIKYGPLCYDFFSFYNAITICRAKELGTTRLIADDANYADEDKYVALWGMSADPRVRLANLLKARLSGSVSVSREFLILFGFYAGYTKNALNIELEKCEFEHLNESIKYEAILMNEMESGYVEELKKIVNDKRYIDTTGIDCLGKPIGDEERTNYDIRKDAFTSAFVSALNDTDEAILRCFFVDKISFEKITKDRVNKLRKSI